MRQRDRAAMGNLLAEQRHHRAGGTEHVAKAHHGKAGAVADRRGCAVTPHGLIEGGKGQFRAAGQRLQAEFSQALAGAHDVGRAHGLVGGNQHEVRHTMFQRGARHRQGTKHVVGQALHRVVLHHGHMLVGGGVVDRVRLPGLHDLAHVLQLAHIAQQRHQLRRGQQRGRLGLQFLVDVVEGEFAVFEQQQALWPLAQDLAAQLAADAAAGAGDQHHLVGDIAADQIRMRRYRIAPEQVFHIQLLELLQAGAAAGQRRHAGHAAHMHRQALQALDDAVALGAVQAGNRQQHIGDCAVAHHFGQAVGGPDFHAVDAVAGLGRIVVNKADHGVLARIAQRRRGLDAGFTCAVNQ